MFLLSLAFAFADAQKVVAIDGGSTGTRSFLVEYDNPDDIYSFHQVNRSDGKPAYYSASKALNKMSKKPGDLEYYNEISTNIFDACFKNGVFNDVPENERPNIPVLVFSTSGMRLLEDSLREEINQYFYDYLKKNTNFKVERSNVRTLSGSEESLYQWVTVNQVAHQIGSNSTLPIVSVGGGSAEFTIELREKPADNFLSQYVYAVYLNGKPHYTYRYSFLEFGTNVAAGNSHLPLLLVDYMKSPCMYTGGDYEILVDPKDFLNGADWYKFAGYGNLTQCYQLFATQVYKKPNPDTCHGYNAIFKDPGNDQCIPVPDTFTDIYGLSTVQDAVNYIPDLKKNNGVNTLKEIMDAAQEYSLKSSTQVLSDNDNDDNALWSISNQAITLNFLLRGFDSFKDAQNIKLITAPSIDGQIVQWGLGAAIATYSNGFSIDEPAIATEKKALPPAAIAGISVAAVVIVILIIGNIALFCCMRRKTKQYEERLNATEEEVAGTVET